MVGSKYILERLDYISVHKKKLLGITVPPHSPEHKAKLAKRRKYNKAWKARLAKKKNKVEEQWSGATRAYRKALDNHAYNIAKGKDAKPSYDKLIKTYMVVPQGNKNIARRASRTFSGERKANTVLQKRINTYRKKLGR